MYSIILKYILGKNNTSKKKKMQGSHDKEMHLAESSQFASKHFSSRFYILTES